MESKIKKFLFLVLFLTSLTATSVNGMFYQEEGEVRLFLDYWTWVQDTNGEWTIARITHCKNAGSNCIIGPTIEGPCD